MSYGQSAGKRRSIVRSALARRSGRLGEPEPVAVRIFDDPGWVAPIAFGQGEASFRGLGEQPVEVGAVQRDEDARLAGLLGPLVGEDQFAAVTGDLHDSQGALCLVAPVLFEPERLVIEGQRRLGVPHRQNRSRVPAWHVVSRTRATDLANRGGALADR